MADYVIIGNGIASLGCIDGIRSVDKDGKITVISREKHPTYARPLISYYLEGKTTPEKMKYRSDDFYEKNGVTVVYGENAQKIDGSRVVCENSGYDFSSLLIATGSSPFVPPFKGLDSVEKKFSFMTLDDALELEAAVDKSSRVLIIGAGLIGLKCAEGLAGRSAHITVCDLADRVLSSILDEPCAKIVADRLTDAGIELRLGTSAAGFDKNTAHMTDGTDVEFDVLVLAVGVRANIALAKDAGLACGRGITVDEKRKKNVDFSDVFFTAAQKIVVQPGSEIASKDDLTGKTIAVQTGTTAESVCMDGGYELLSFTSNNDAVAALTSGKADAWVVDSEVAAALAEQQGLVVLDEAMTEEPYAFAFKKGSDTLVQAVNQALAELKADGTVQKIFEKYGVAYGG